MKTKKGLLYELKTKKGLFLLLVPGVVFLLINNYLPMLGMVIAFKDIQRLGSNIFETYLNNPWAGFENFEFFFRTTDAWIITRNTILYNIAFIILGILLGVTLSIVISEITNKRMAKFYQTVMMLPNFLSWVVISGIAYAFLTNRGFINTLIIKPLGMDPVAFYSEPKYWPFILVAVNLWYNLGVNCVLYLATLTGINTEYYEAATIDGASKWKQIVHISLPFLKPTVIVLFIISLGGIFHANFGLFYNVPRESGILFRVTNVIDTYVYRALNAVGSLEMASAASFYQSVVGFVVVLLANTTISKIDPDNAMF